MYLLIYWNIGYKLSSWMQLPQFAMHTWRRPSWGISWNLRISRRQHQAMVEGVVLVLFRSLRCLLCMKLCATQCSFVEWGLKLPCFFWWKSCTWVMLLSMLHVDGLRLKS